MRRLIGVIGTDGAVARGASGAGPSFLRARRGTSLAGYLDGVAKVAEAIIPSCVGVSITIILDGDPFTITATTPDATALDAVQNLDGGPCLEALETEELLGVDDLLDEGR